MMKKQMIQDFFLGLLIAFTISIIILTAVMAILGDSDSSYLNRAIFLAFSSLLADQLGLPLRKAKFSLAVGPWLYSNYRDRYRLRFNFWLVQLWGEYL